MINFENYLLTHGVDDELKRTKIKYALEIIKHEFTKLAILLALSILGGYFVEFLFAFIILLPIRSFAGGMHMKSNIGCFLYTLLFFVLAVYALPMLAVGKSFLLSILMISSIVIVILAPMQNNKRPIRTQQRYIAMKIRTIFFVAIAFIVLSILLNSNNIALYKIGTWTICLQALQMAIYKIKLKV